MPITVKPAVLIAALSFVLAYPVFQTALSASFTTVAGYNFVSGVKVSLELVSVFPLAALSITRYAELLCALIFVVVAVTLLLLTNQAYVLDPSATAATHTMATAAASCFFSPFTLLFVSFISSSFCAV